MIAAAWLFSTFWQVSYGTRRGLMLSLFGGVVQYADFVEATWFIPRGFSIARTINADEWCHVGPVCVVLDRLVIVPLWFPLAILALSAAGLWWRG